jgi:signal transduction histidine kinase
MTRRDLRVRARSFVAWRPSMLLLVLGVALLVAAAAQAYTTERSPRGTVEQVLRDYAGTAAWTFDQEARSSMAGDLQMVFQPAVNGRPPVSPAALLLPQTPSTPCLDEVLAHVHFALRITLHGDDLDVGGELPPHFDDAALTAVREAVEAHWANVTQAERFSTGAVFPLDLGGRPHLVAYTTRTWHDDVHAYALVLDSAGAAPFFNRVLAGRRLLPATLMGELTDTDALALRIEDANGRTLFATSAAPSAYTARQPLQRFGGLVLSAGILPPAADRLIIGGPPASRMPLLSGLLLLALGLLAVAVQQLRREQALSRLRGDFVSSVSHELRTPLALQRVFLDMIALGRVHTPEKRQWCMDNIDRESRRLAHLIENVLHFSRAEQGTMKVVPVEAALAPAIADIVETFRPLAETARTEFVVSLDDTVGALFDGAALRQMLMNVLENAVKYGPDGQVVHVSLELVGGAAVIAVEDEGAGIPAVERDAVFEPFRRGVNTLGRAVAGSGIGLAVVRELARRHGGEARAADAQRGGARIEIMLPHAHRMSDTGQAPAPRRTVAAAGV